MMKNSTSNNLKIICVISSTISKFFVINSLCFCLAMEFEYIDLDSLVATSVLILMLVFAYISSLIHDEYGYKLKMLQLKEKIYEDTTLQFRKRKET